jgi:hypothetical protein
MPGIKPLQFHKSIRRKSCINTPHVHCQYCDKSIIMPRGFTGSGKEPMLCKDCLIENKDAVY